MKVALVAENFYPTVGGIQEHMYYFSRQLLRMGHEPLIVTPRVFTRTPFAKWWPSDLPPEIYHPVGFSLPFFINNSKGRMSAGFFMGTRLKRLLRKQNVDIVHLHPPISGILPILASHFASVPVVGTFHTYFTGSKGITLAPKPLQRHIDRMSKVIAVSPNAAQAIGRFLDMDAVIIPNGVDTDVFHPLRPGDVDDRLPEYRDGKINIVFMGRPDPRNGLDIILQSMSQLQRRGLPVRLLIVGSGDMMGQYQRWVENEKLKDVVFLGSMREERARVYRTADIHVIHVERASFSMVLAEGMASGLPIVATDYNGIEFAGNPGEHFLTTPYGNAEGLTETLVKLIRDADLRKRLGEKSRERGLEYDWKNIAAQVVDIYEEVLGLPRTTLKAAHLGAKEANSTASSASRLAF